MRNLLVWIVLPSFYALPLMAQDTFKLLVFGGYQYLYAGNLDGSNDGTSTNGWPSLTITVGTTITGCPPYRPGRALISASGSYRR